MIEAGQIVLLAFPFADLSSEKVRPVLLLRQASRRFDDWLVCMISSQLHQAEAELDEVMLATDPAFPATGLKVASIFRLSRVAVVAGDLLIGRIGVLELDRLRAVRHRLAQWLSAD